MSMKEPPRRTAAPPRRRDGKGSARRMVSTHASTLAAREAAVRADERTSSLRKEAADRRDELADRRDQAAEQREHEMNLRVKAARELAESHKQLAARSSEANGRLVQAAVGAETKCDAAEHAARQMSYRAEHDALTNLPNRSLLQSQLDRAIARALGRRRKFVMMYLDIDHFKKINDAFGHAVGDQLLQSTAHRLQACLRRSDALFRVGGDEFVVLLPEVQDLGDGIRIAQELIAAMGQPHVIDGHQLQTSLSIGLACYPAHGKDAPCLTRSADHAMYAAKHNGGNNFRLATAHHHLSNTAEY